MMDARFIPDFVRIGSARHRSCIEKFSVMFARVARLLATAPVRKRARGTLLGLLSQCERRSGCDSPRPLTWAAQHGRCSGC